MREKKFTPGPWVPTRNHAFWQINKFDENNNWVTTVGDVCSSYPTDPDTGLQEANANLIAEAPDLLKILEAMSAQFKEEVADGEYCSIYVQAQAAIAKAYGE